MEQGDRMHVVGLIPARGGSKGIPRKNIVDLAGKPLFYHVLDAAREAGGLDRLAVSTEDPEIKALAEARGAEVIDRPLDLARDDTPSLPVFQHAVRAMEAEGTVVDWVLILQATYPFVTPARIGQVLNAVGTTTADSVTTLTEMPFHHHPYNVRRRRDDGLAEFMFPEEKAGTPNRQAAPVVYGFGNLVATRRRVLLEENSVYGRHTAPVFVRGWEAIDIDDRFDLELARWLASRPDLRR